MALDGAGSARATALAEGAASVALTAAAEALSYVPRATPAPPSSRTITITREEHPYAYAHPLEHGTYARGTSTLAPYARANVWLRPRGVVAVDARRAEVTVRALP